MNKQWGYSLMELATVLVVLALITGGAFAGFAHYRDKAEYIGAGRNHELGGLIDELKKVPATAQGAGDGEGEAGDAGTPEPEVGDGGNGPFWRRWLDWWRETGRHDNRRNGR